MNYRLVQKRDRSRKLLMMAAGWMAVVVPTVMPAQATATAFEAVSIKPHPSGAVVSPPLWGAMIAYVPDGISRGIFPGNYTLSVLVEQAYGLLYAPQGEDMDMVSGEPDWAKTERFDIEAKMSETDIAEMQTLSRDGQETRRNLMLQALLADRFKLKIHWEKRKLPIYALVVAKGGAKLTPFLENRGSNSLGNDHITLQGGGDTVGFFAAELAKKVGRVVFDRTGIKGSYDMTLKWTADEAQFLQRGEMIPPPSDNRNAPPNLYTAIEDQLGLRLEPTQAPLDVLVIDHVERPTPD